MLGSVLSDMFGFGFTCYMVSIGLAVYLFIYIITCVLFEKVIDRKEEV